MKYQKPELTQIGTALRLIESGLGKHDAFTDNGAMSVDAYQADE